MTKSQIRKLAAKYPKFVEWSEEDQCFIGRCPMLFDGAIHGQDEAKVYKELCETAEEWITILENDRTPPPNPKRKSAYSGKFMVRIDPTLHQRLALKAVAEGESLNNLIAKALTQV
ncbi:MAG TPA: toxin-antitoxin system HicB family antitoxin [Verrucomicrobiae bacterium]|nr:toxin-antitoxin system HicB family antitoxin [Verrucomicrobiae bacterium]